MRLYAIILNSDGTFNCCLQGQWWSELNDSYQKLLKQFPDVTVAMIFDGREVNFEETKALKSVE